MNKKWLAFFDFLIMGFTAGMGGVMVSTMASDEEEDKLDKFNREVFGE